MKSFSQYLEEVAKDPTRKERDHRMYGWVNPNQPLSNWQIEEKRIKER
jgi:hypothetical protein